MRWILTLALALSFTIPVTAEAQTRAEIRDAKKLVGEGKAAYKAGKYSEAVAAFTRAYELSGRSELLFNIGQSLRLAGDLRGAEAHLQQYLAESPQAPNADEVVNAIVEIQQEIAANLATVQVDTAVAGRSVFVGDETEPRCSTPCAVTLPPGEQRLTVRGEGALDKVEKLTLEPGKTVPLQVELSVSEPRGHLWLTTDRPAGTLRIGETVAALPLAEPLEIEAGEHDVSVEAARNARWTGQVNVEPNGTTTLFVPMQGMVDARRRGSVRKSIAYGLWGASLAAGAGGVLLGMQARDTFDTLEGQRERDQFVDPELVTHGRTQQTGANIMFAAASATLLSGVVLFLWDQLAAEKDPVPRN